MSEEDLRSEAIENIRRAVQSEGYQTFMTELRQFRYGRQADNPQIGNLDSLNRFPKSFDFGGEKDERWQEFAADIEQAVRDLNAEFFQDLADAAEELRAARPKSAEALHLAKGFIRDARREGKPIIKGEIKDQIIELWAHQLCNEEGEPTNADWEKAREKARDLQWSRDVFKPAGIADAPKKPKRKKRIR